MYDTVYFKINQRDVGGVDFLAEIPLYLERVGQHYFDGVPVISGMIDNLRVTASQHQVKVKDGSLCKFYFGDNYQTMNRHDVQLAIEELSDRLHLPMWNANITRLDIAQNIIMKYPVEVYFNHLGLLSRAQRLQQPSGLYYNFRGGQYCFYDKNREQKVHNEPIPPLYQNRNVLRVELRYLQRLPQRLNRLEVKGATLFDEMFINGLIHQWRDGYRAIQKINDVSINFEIMKGKKELNRIAIAYYVEQQGGELAFYAQIKEGQKRGELSDRQAYDLREAVKSACSLRDGVTTKNEAIQELNTKIDQAARMYR